MKPTECIIIGGGSSINEGISVGLKDALEGRFVIACNYAYKFFPRTLTCFIDRDFYYPSQDCTKNKTHPYIYEDLKKEPLIVGYNTNGVSEFKLPNTILLKGTGQYNIQPLDNGFYHPFLCGIWALSLAQFLLDYDGIIYLCGYDWNKRPIETIDKLNYQKKDESIETHFYSDKKINHQGQHYLSGYENHDPDYYFKYFIEPNIKIWNISLNSNISNFDKISYVDIFKKINPIKYNQLELREYIKIKLNSSSQQIIRN